MTKTCALCRLGMTLVFDHIGGKYPLDVGKRY
jgi:hypothetical protein